MWIITEISMSGVEDHPGEEEKHNREGQGEEEAEE